MHACGVCSRSLTGLSTVPGAATHCWSARAEPRRQESRTRARQGTGSRWQEAAVAVLLELN
eukprot:scaffold2879_cov269-Prasinococcus_capsulatus_cf.AAC.25